MQDELPRVRIVRRRGLQAPNKGTVTKFCLRGVGVPDGYGGGVRLMRMDYQEAQTRTRDAAQKGGEHHRDPQGGQVEGGTTWAQKPLQLSTLFGQSQLRALKLYHL